MLAPGVADGVAVVIVAAPAGPADVQEALAPLPWRAAVRAVLLAFEPDTACRGPGGADWLERYPLPVVASLSGHVSAAAAALALACDVRVGAPGLVLQVELPPSPRLRLLAGRDVACVEQRGGRLDAATALAVGLVSALAAPEDEAHALGRSIAATIASRGPVATRLAKEAIWRGLPQAFEQALRFETDLTLLLQTTKDRAEGVRAFLEKRAPNFTGK